MDLNVLNTPTYNLLLHAACMVSYACTLVHLLVRSLLGTHKYLYSDHAYIKLPNDDFILGRLQLHDYSATMTHKFKLSALN